MDIRALDKLIQSTESYRIEKTSSTTNTDKFCQAICAFSNDLPGGGQPGYLLIGVNDDGCLSGLRVTDKLLTEISGLRTDGNILPFPSMSVDYVSFEGGDVIIVKVVPSLDPPVRYRGRCYIRIGPRRDIATRQEELILSERRISQQRSFDMNPCREATLEDLDLESFTRVYLPQAFAEDVLANDSREIKEQLSSLRLFDKRQNCPTNAAVLLFAKNIKYFFPGAYIQHVQFDGIDNAAEIVNQNEFAGNLITVLPRLEAFVETSIIQKRPSPVSVLQERILVNYPQWAIRELLMNAVMHRDYSSNTPTKFYQYKDRIEIINPGGLYGNANPENFPDVNDYRNPIVAEALKVLGYVNKFNRGIARVQKELIENGNGPAVFSVNKITVFAVNVLVNKPVNEINLFENLILPSRSHTVLTLLQGGAMPQSAILPSIGLSYQTHNVRAYINPLIHNGLITKVPKREHHTRSLWYTLTEKGKRYLQFLSR